MSQHVDRTWLVRAGCRYPTAPCVGVTTFFRFFLAISRSSVPSTPGSSLLELSRKAEKQSYRGTRWRCCAAGTNGRAVRHGKQDAAVLLSLDYCSLHANMMYGLEVKSPALQTQCGRLAHAEVLGENSTRRVDYRSLQGSVRPVLARLTC